MVGYRPTTSEVQKKAKSTRQRGKMLNTDEVHYQTNAYQEPVNQERADAFTHLFTP